MAFQQWLWIITISQVIWKSSAKTAVIEKQYIRMVCLIFMGGNGHEKRNNFRYKIALTNIVSGPLMFDMTLILQLHMFGVGAIEMMLLSPSWIIGVASVIVPKLRSESDCIIVCCLFLALDCHNNTLLWGLNMCLTLSIEALIRPCHIFQWNDGVFFFLLLYFLLINSVSLFAHCFFI